MIIDLRDFASNLYLYVRLKVVRSLPFSNE